MITGARPETIYVNDFFDSGYARFSRPHVARRKDTVMKNGRKQIWLAVQMFAATVVLLLAAPGLLAQTTTSGSSGSASTNFRNNPATDFNPPPCDFTDAFYNDVGISTSAKSNGPGSTPAEKAQGVDTAVAQRFGLFRKTGPPAIFPSQVNWVTDKTCSTRDGVRNNVRILATTGGYIDDGTGSPTDFISIIAFITNQSFFETNFVSGDNNCSVPVPPNLPNSGCVVITNGDSQVTPPPPAVGFGLNARNNGPGNTGPGPVGSGQGDDMQDIVMNFEAYPALKQRLSSGTFAPIPCGSLDTVANNPINLNPGLPSNPPSNCFPVGSIATPQLRQDWRFATNRNAVDGSDNNVVNGSGSTGTIAFNSPYGYFCDDLLGMWINTYFWFTQDPGTQGPCTSVYNMLDQNNGVNLDGTPIVKTADELNNDLEAVGCAQEGKLDFGGADGGAVWLICPAIADPTNGAISLDAFLDQVHRPNGLPLDPGFTLNFFCLQFFGQFCSNLTAAQVNSAQVQGAMSQVAAAAAPAASTN
jgi:hypothetical protein